MKLLYDVTNNKWYNSNGESFPADNPAIPYGNREQVEIQLYDEVSGINSGSSAVEDWIKFTQFNDGGYSAILATDNNFLHWFKAQLKTTVPAGALTTPIEVITQESLDNIAEKGNIYLYNAGKPAVTVAYSTRREISGGIEFIPVEAQTLENSYNSGVQVDIPEMLYAEAVMDPALSDPATGLFVFDFICDSTKLRNKMQYASVEKVDDCKGLELTVFQVAEDNTVAIRKRCRLTTFRITGGIADVKSGVTVPEPEQNEILALLSAFIAQGFELQFSSDGEAFFDYQNFPDPQSIRYYRLRVKDTSGAWSEKIPLIQGTPGEDGKSVYPYIAYAENPDGTGFTLEWEDNAQLKYVAYKMSDSIIENPQAADFAGLWVRFKGEDMVPYWEEGAGTVMVTWDSISGIPETFPPAGHNHTKDNISDCARQTLLECSSTTVTPDISREILHYSINSSQLTFNFTAINSGGAPYTGSPGDVFTWELWVDVDRTLEGFSFGGASELYVLPGFPELLPLVNSKPTRHVFTLRGRYKDGVPNNIKLILNYAYSEEV